MKKITQQNDRWKLAQQYEVNWWKKLGGNVKSDYYRNSANEIRNLLVQEGIPLTETTSILEVGSGMCGILTFLNESKERFAIDPLESEFADIPAFIALRDKSVKYLSAKGENIPFDSEKFNLVILDNVLDHCEIPVRVIDEIKRVLKKRGVVFFRQNTYNSYGKFARGVMEVFRIDKGHPFTFTKRDLKTLFENAGFKIASTNRTGYFSTWIWEVTSRSLKDKLKALLFITRDKVTYLITKE